MAVQQFLNLVSGVYQKVTAAQLGGSSYAGQIPALNNSTGLLDVTMMPSGVGPNTDTVTASESLAAGALVNLWTNAGVAAVRNADNTSTAKNADGFVLAAVSSSATATVYLSGIVTGLTGLTPGTPYYLGTVGGVLLAGSLPSGAGTINQYIGKALSATTLEFSPQPQVNN